MFRRKAYDRLLAWKGADDRTAMLIEGARRVGKSTVAEEFAKNEYESYALIDFTRVDAEFKQTFLDLRNDLDGLFLYLSACAQCSTRFPDSWRSTRRNWSTPRSRRGHAHGTS